MNALVMRLRRARRGLRPFQATGRVRAGSGAVVMGTGIVSVALSLDGYETASLALLVLAVVAWAALGVMVFWLAVAHRAQFLAEARSPAGLTGVAGTAVLGVRVAELGWPTVAAILLGLAFAAWAPLMLLVLRRVPATVAGEYFMVTVASEGIAALAATVASAERSAWLLDFGLAAAVVGVALYPIVLARFDLRELSAGHGDHWVAGGALAICSLAVAHVTVASVVGGLGDVHGLLADSSLALWFAAMAWLPALVVYEIRWRRLAYDTRRWATVFPLGMYAACSFAVAAAAGAPAIGGFARGWVWVAAAGWLVVFAAMVRGWRLAAEGRPQRTLSSRHSSSSAARAGGRRRRARAR